MKAAVITDSGSDIYTQDVNLEGLFRVPFQVIDGDKVYLDGETITIDAGNSWFFTVRAPFGLAKASNAGDSGMRAF